MAFFSHIRTSVATLALLGCALLSAPAQANGQAEWDYTVYMGGLRVIDFRLGVAIADGRYRLNGLGETRGLADFLARRAMRVESEGVVDAAGHLVPERHHRVSSKRSGDRAVTLRFANRMLQEAVANPAYAPDEVASAELTSAPGLLDPMSALLAVFLRPTGADPCAVNVQSFDGKRLYTVQGKGGQADSLEPSDYNAYAGPALRCAVEIIRQDAPEALGKDEAGKLAIDPDKDFSTTQVRVWMVPGGPAGSAVAVRAELSTDSGFQALVHLQTPLQQNTDSPPQSAARLTD